MLKTHVYYFIKGATLNGHFNEEYTATCSHHYGWKW